MPRTGRPSTSTAELEARGSASASTRRMEEKRRRIEEQRAKLSKRRRPSEKTILSPSERCARLLCDTGYDPWRTPGSATFHPKPARAAVRWFHKHLVHVKGEWANKPFVLEPWQQAIVMNVYGWLNEDGTRRYREVFIYVPRKNGKTAMSSGLALHSFFEDEEPGAENLCAAGERNQAALLWNVARQQVLLDEDLAAACDVYQNGIVMKADPLTSFRAISAEAGTKHGYNPHFVVIDELHVQKDGTLVEALRTGMGARRQPLMVYITTADYQGESVCNRIYEHACKVRDGVIDDPSFLPVIYEAGVEDDWTSEEVWKAANPNYGVSVKPEFLRQECAKAKARPAEIDSFRRLYLNVRTNAESAAIDVVQWDACRADADVERLRGERCHGGLDLSTSIDLTAFALWFPDHEATLCWFWIPREVALVAQHRDRVPYLQWADEGWLEFTEGNVVDYPHVEERIRQICEPFALTDIAYDPWNARATALRLIAEGVDMQEFRQGPGSYSGPLRKLEGLIASGKLDHGGNPVLRWCASNVMWRRDVNDNIAPDKKKSTGRIDGICAVAMALGRAIVQEEPAEVGVTVI